MCPHVVMPFRVKERLHLMSVHTKALSEEACLHYHLCTLQVQAGFQ